MGKELEKEGVGVTVINMSTIKPLDTKFLLRLVKNVNAIVTVEEHQIAGGLGSAVAEFLSEAHPIKIGRIGIEDQFGQSGTAEDLYQEYKLTGEHIVEKVKSCL